MTNIQHILKAINKVSLSRKTLSNANIITILKSVKKVSNDVAFINTLLFIKTTINPKISKKANSLTARENQILHFIGNGKQSNAIATQLKLSNSTIETHRKNIRKKLGLVGKGKLLEFAILHNLAHLKLSINKK